MIKNCKAILLDFDGVIVDSMPAHLEAWRLAFLEVFQKELEQDTLDKLVGRSTQHIARFLCNIENKPLLADQLSQRKSSIIESNSFIVDLLPGSREFIDLLHTEEVKFGIVSNAPRSFISKTLRSHRIKVPFFTGIEDYKRPKPHPEPYIQGAKYLGFQFTDHRDCYVFEDSLHGLKSAIDAKMNGIGISSLHNDQDLKNVGAIKVYRNLSEALDLSFLRRET